MQVARLQRSPFHSLGHFGWSTNKKPLLRVDVYVARLRFFFCVYTCAHVLYFVLPGVRAQSVSAWPLFLDLHSLPSHLYLASAVNIHCSCGHVFLCKCVETKHHGVELTPFRAPSCRPRINRSATSERHPISSRHLVLPFYPTAVTLPAG